MEAKVIRKTLRYLLLLGIILCILVSGCTNLSFNQIVDRYNRKPMHKALAVARDATGRWACGTSTGQPTEQRAIEKALSRCNHHRDLHKVNSQCVISSVNGRAVSGSSTPSPQPPPQPSQEKYDVPIWNVGDSWRYRYADKRVWQHTVERIEGNFYIVKDENAVDKPCFDKRNLELKYHLTPQGRKIVPKSELGIYYDSPLYVGKKWSKMVSGQDTEGVSLDYLHEFRVLSFENITVPAGTFKAFKIEFSRQSGSRSSSIARWHIWYSPDVKNIVKYLYVSTVEAAGWKIYGQDFELISFKLGDKQWPPLEKKLVPQELDTTTKPQAPLPDKPPIVKPVTPSPVKNIVVVTGTSANIRSGAGNEFPAITIVKQGDKLILLGEYGEWFNVRLENGEEGWINRKFAK